MPHTYVQRTKRRHTAHRLGLCRTAGACSFQCSTPPKQSRKVGDSFRCAGEQRSPFLHSLQGGGAVLPVRAAGAGCRAQNVRAAACGANLAGQCRTTVTVPAPACAILLPADAAVCANTYHECYGVASEASSRVVCLRTCSPAWPAFPTRMHACVAGTARPLRARAATGRAHAPGWGGLRTYVFRRTCNMSRRPPCKPAPTPTTRGSGHALRGTRAAARRAAAARVVRGLARPALVCMYACLPLPPPHPIPLRTPAPSFPRPARPALSLLASALLRLCLLVRPSRTPGSVPCPANFGRILPTPPTPALAAGMASYCNARAHGACPPPGSFYALAAMHPVFKGCAGAS